MEEKISINDLQKESFVWWEWSSHDSDIYISTFINQEWFKQVSLHEAQTGLINATRYYGVGLEKIIEMREIKSLNDYILQEIDKIDPTLYEELDYQIQWRLGQPNYKHIKRLEHRIACLQEECSKLKNK